MNNFSSSFAIQKTLTDTLTLGPAVQGVYLYTTSPVGVNLTLSAGAGNVALNTDLVLQAAFGNGLPLSITDGANIQALTLNLLGQPTGTRAAELINLLNLRTAGDQGLLKFFFNTAPTGGGSVRFSSDDPSITGSPVTISNASRHSSIIVTATTISPPVVSLIVSA